MLRRLIDIRNRGATASWRASWNGALRLIMSSARAAHHVEHAQPCLPQQVIKRFKGTPEEAHGPSQRWQTRRAGGQHSTMRLVQRLHMLNFAKGSFTGSCLDAILLDAAMT
jgi:hypothetical protein